MWCWHNDHNYLSIYRWHVYARDIFTGSRWLYRTNIGCSIFVPATKSGMSEETVRSVNLIFPFSEENPFKESRKLDIPKQELDFSCVWTSLIYDIQSSRYWVFSVVWWIRNHQVSNLFTALGLVQIIRNNPLPLILNTCYPQVIWHSCWKKRTVFDGKTPYKWPLSIVMSAITRG